MNQLKLFFKSPGENRATGKKLKMLVSKAEKVGFRVEAIPLQEQTLGSMLQDSTRGTSAIIIAGGDGSLNWVINNIIHQGLTPPPLAVVPWGTSNDFAHQLAGGPFRLEKLFESIKKGKAHSLDVGCLNNRYFINVAGAGGLVNVAHKTSYSLKQSLGMTAYYLEGARSLPEFKPFPLKIENKGYREETEVFLFLILNSKGAGGLYNLAPSAALNDGKMDILLIKNTGIGRLITLFPKLLKGLHIEDPRVSYFQADQLEIEAPLELETDIDGEPGPPFPLSFRVLPRRLKFIFL